ncbi:MAG: NAD-dependent epimerase/dehydratase family protein [Candidatus Xenobiia bacterium LiM19]
MKVVVFGGSGFLGSHVADCLTEANHEVSIFDINESPFIRQGQKLIIGDILDFEHVHETIKGSQCVYNFAGMADLDDATTKPITSVSLNITGNVHILEACRLEKVKRFVYASTIYVYSQKGGFYRCSKQASELYIEEYQRRYGLDYTVLRYGSLYGLRADDRNAIYHYLKEATGKKYIHCMGTGDEVREYVNVKDAARLSVNILNEEYANRYIIITGHHPMKTRDMIYMINEILGGDLQIDFSDKSHPAHYDYTPYSFTPKIGQKLVDHCYIDMGQGLLECLDEMTTRDRD